MMDRVQDSLYEETYYRYLEEDTAKVRRNCRAFCGTYPLSVLVPKFMFLHALTWVQAGDAEGFKAALTELVEKYPRADVAELAGEMLKGVLRGRPLMQGSMSRMTWNLRFGLDADGILSAADSARQFTDEPETPHRVLLVYKTGSVDRNQLLYAVAAFNFANFTVNVFDLNIETVGTLSIMTLTGFHNLDETLEYVKMIYGPNGYASVLGQTVSYFPFSDRNYETLLRGKTLEEYMIFFVEHYAAKAPELIARWKIQMEADEKLAEMEDREVEKAAGLADEEETVVSEEETPEENAVQPEEQPEESPKEEQPVEQEAPPQEAPEEEQATPEEEQAAPPAGEKVEEESPTPKKPAEITLEQLLERRKQADLEEEQRKEEEAKAVKQKKKEAEALKKQKAKERELARKQKQKESKERLKQKEKERKEKERANKQPKKKR
jgi:hypothetical protein